MHHLILWDETSKKWMDVGNNFWCSPSQDGTPQVRARYGFEDGASYKNFSSEEQALEFFVNYLYSRVVKNLDDYSKI